LFRTNLITPTVVLRVTDALAICELQILAYSLELIGIPRIEHPPGMDRSKIPTSYFVTSPNMKQIPNISKDTKDTYIRQNGRFWTHDLALFPQWFFPGTKHLTFITRRPSIEVLPTHPLRFVWYDLEATDYVPEPGSVADLFRVCTAISDEFYKLQKELDQKIEALVAS